ncbi:zinc/iron transporter [Holotrichia oblita]|nr:zinc/iron transporter [Holotrichia oblita]
MLLLENLHPLALTVIMSLFTWGLTALGAAMVFFFKTVNRRIMDIMLGFAGGVMIAAAFWSLIAPALDLAESLGQIKILWPALGFLGGGLFVTGASRLLDKASFLKSKNLDSHKRSILMVFSVTLHNIPEGLCVGVAFGAFALNIPSCDALGGLLLALGIGIQNFPEGAAVSFPLRRDGISRLKAFSIGQASGIVEPIATIIGYFLATQIRTLLPFVLSFSAGAMIAVVASELLPEATQNHKHSATIGCLVGFLVMMMLDVMLG